jgi:diguanylate cyclase (GGDEF)-like protein
VPGPALLAAAAGQRVLEVEGVGECRCLSVPVGDSPGTTLLLARSGDIPFSGEEANLVRAMARCLALSLNSLRLLEDERALRLTSQSQAQENARLVGLLQERQRLLERLSGIQRSISLRAPVQQVLNAIVEGAAELTGDEVVGLRIVDPDDPGHMVLMAHAGLSEEAAAGIARTPIGDGAGGRAFVEDRLVVIEDYSHSEGALAALSSENLRSAMAAPVRENGRPIGSITVASRDVHTYSAAQRDVVLAFAEHASLALTDAQTVAAMKHQAFHDALTGLPNRALFLDRLGQAINRTRDEVGAHAAVLFIDLDRFKTVNDSLGHSAGDELLAAVGRLLAQSVRDTDTAARLGGDEFAVVVEDSAGQDHAMAVAERLRIALSVPVQVGDQTMSVAATVGVAIADGTQTPSELLRNADLAMYSAKINGAGVSALYVPSMYAAVVDRLDLEASLLRAVDLGQFVVHYQPIVELTGSRVRGVEALVRWNHPTRGLLGPNEFIPTAEETGLIVRIGNWVLAESMRQVSEWGHDLSLSVNISARQLQRPELINEVRQTLDASGLDPRRLTLEITETTLMQETEAVIEQLRRLKGLGLRIAIDDFGTGYSSLGYLRRFPIDVLKIDRSFVKDLGEGNEEAAVASAIMTLCEALHLDAVAEGIESHRQVAELRQIGCSLGQGFLFSKPLPAAGIEKLLAAPKRPRLVVA